MKSKWTQWDSGWVFLMMMALIATSFGCASSKSAGLRPPALASSGARVDELILISMPVAVNLDAQPGVDGVVAKIYAVNHQRPKTQPIVAGTLEVLMFEGVVSQFLDQTNRCRHLWPFSPAELAAYAFTTTIGTGYNLALNWGNDRPQTDRITVVARYRPPQGSAVYSAPSYISLGGK